MHPPCVNEHCTISVSFYMQEKLSAYVNCKINGLGMYIFSFYSSHIINAHNWLRLGFVHRHLFVNIATSIFYLNCGILFTDFTELWTRLSQVKAHSKRWPIRPFISSFHFQLLWFLSWIYNSLRKKNTPGICWDRININPIPQLGPCLGSKWSSNCQIFPES